MGINLTIFLLSDYLVYTFVFLGKPIKQFSNMQFANIMVLVECFI